MMLFNTQRAHRREMMFANQQAFGGFIQQTRVNVLMCPHKAHIVELLWPYLQKLEKELYPNPRDRAQNDIIDDMPSFLRSLNSRNYLKYLSLHPNQDDRKFLAQVKYFIMAQLLWHISQTSEEDLLPSKIDQFITEPSCCSFNGIPLTIYDDEDEVKETADTIEKILAIPRGRRQYTDGIKYLRQIKDYLDMQTHLPGFSERLYRKRLSRIDWAQCPIIEAAYRKKSEEDRRQVLMSDESWRAFVDEARRLILSNPLGGRA